MLSQRKGETIKFLTRPVLVTQLDARHNVRSLKTNTVRPLHYSYDRSHPRNGRTVARTRRWAFCDTDARNLLTFSAPRCRRRLPCAKSAVRKRRLAHAPSRAVPFLRQIRETLRQVPQLELVLSQARAARARASWTLLHDTNACHAAGRELAGGRHASGARRAHAPRGEAASASDRRHRARTHVPRPAAARRLRCSKSDTRSSSCEWGTT
jgi:hypothetical protein